MEKGFYHPERGYWQSIGTPPEDVINRYPEGTKEVPLRPGEYYEWDDTWEVWVNNPPTIEEQREEWRKTAKLTRREFCSTLVKLGILSRQDGVTAAKGDWPVAFEPALEQMDEDTAIDAEIAWASVTEVRRLDPFIQIMANFLQMSGEQLDDLFGWQNRENTP